MDKIDCINRSSTDFYFETLAAALDGLRRERILTDFKLISQEGDELPVHRVVLMFSCPYFRRLLTGSSSATESSFVLPPNVNTNCMNGLLDFIYTGQVSLPQNLNDVKDMVRTAQFLELDHFNKHLAKALSHSVTAENFNCMWDLADEFNNEKLRDVVISYVSKDLQGFCEQSPFLALDVGRMGQLLASPCLEINTAKSVLMAVINWQSVDPEIRTRQMEDELLPLIKFPFIPKNVLEQVLSSEPTVQKSGKLWRCIAETLYSRGKHVIGYQPEESPSKDRKIPTSRDNLKGEPEIDKCNIGDLTYRTGDEQEMDNQSHEEYTDDIDSELPNNDVKQMGSNKVVVIDMQHLKGDGRLRSQLESQLSMLNNANSLAVINSSKAGNLQSSCTPTTLTDKKQVKLGLKTQTPTKKRAKSAKDQVLKDHDKIQQNSIRDQYIVIVGRRKGGEAAAHCYNLQSCTWVAAVVIEDSLANNAAWAIHGNQLYLAGGTDTEQNVLNTTLVYNIEQNYTRMVGHMNMARSSSHAAVVGWHVYVVGGLGHHHKPLNHVERYNVLLDQWETVESLPYAGWDIAVAAYDGKIWAMGGRARVPGDGSRTQWTLACHVYDPEVYQWTEVGRLPDDFSSTSPVIAVHNKRIYAIKHYAPTLMWAFDFNGRKWFRLHMTVNSVLRRALSIIPFDNKLLVFDYGCKMVIFNLESNTWDRECPFSRSIAVPLYSGLVQLGTVFGGRNEI